MNSQYYVIFLNLLLISSTLAKQRSKKSLKSDPVMKSIKKYQDNIIKAQDISKKSTKMTQNNFKVPSEPVIMSKFPEIHVATSSESILGLRGTKMKPEINPNDIETSSKAPLNSKEKTKKNPKTSSKKATDTQAKDSKRKSVKPSIDDFGTPSEPEIGPKGMPYNKSTSCEQFGKFARFNPHSIVGIKWFVFYYWANPMSPQIFQFLIPSKRDLSFIHHYLDGHLPKHFNWSATLVLKRDLMNNITTLLEEKGDRGQYIEYGIFKDIPKGKITMSRSIRIKQTGDSKYLAVLVCKERIAVVMSPINAVPPQKKIQDEITRLGFIGRKGKSYLYQGHEWMPIPEQSEREFWLIHRKLKDL